jgi:hypothetical protein
MKFLFTSCILLTVYTYSVYGQYQTGLVIAEKDKKPIEFVNIGVIGKGIGTTSNTNGYYNLKIDDQYNNDSLRFSCIGYESYSVKISDFKNLQNKNIALKEKYYSLKEVIISPKKFKLKTFGYTSGSKAMRAGFKENLLGYEAGIYLKIKKSARLNKINLNVVECTYDTIFYRINVYKVIDKMNFQNVLIKPIYFTLSKDIIKDRITIDLSKENICVIGDCLVTIEYVKYLGVGQLMFSASFPGKTYYRKTSQANWDTVPIRISLSVEANVEK